MNENPPARDHSLIMDMDDIDLSQEENQAEIKVETDEEGDQIKAWGNTFCRFNSRRKS